MKLSIANVAFAATSLASGASALDLHIGKQKSQYISTALEFKQTLRMCNAYPYSADGVSVLGQHIAYKSCADVTQSIHSGDQIDFWSAADKSVLVGSFEVSELPKNDALLLLVIQPHDDISTGVKFQSHIFSNSDDAQVALLDAYVGPAEPVGGETFVTIADKKETNPKYESRKEELKFNTVVAVNPGLYEVGVHKVLKALFATDGVKYSVVRVGVKAPDAEKIQYPEDLIVFPEQKKSMMTTTNMVIGASALAAVAAAAWYFLL